MKNSKLIIATLLFGIGMFVMGGYSFSSNQLKASEKGTTDRLIEQLEKMNNHMENIDTNVSIIRAIMATERGLNEDDLEEFKE